jgi:hypothetical protein
MITKSTLRESDYLDLQRNISLQKSRKDRLATLAKWRKNWVIPNLVFDQLASYPSWIKKQEAEAEMKREKVINDYEKKRRCDESISHHTVTG